MVREEYSETSSYHRRLALALLPLQGSGYAMTVAHLGIIENLIALIVWRERVTTTATQLISAIIHLILNLHISLLSPRLC